MEAPANPPQATPPAADLYVSESGSDEASGTVAEPLRTIDRALALAGPGERIEVEPGTYPAIADTRARTGTVTVHSEGGASVAGMALAGSTDLTVEGLRFTAPVRIEAHPVYKQAQVASDIELVGNDITAPGYCVTIRDAAKRITLRGNEIHDCRSGVVGPGNPPGPRATGISILNNTIEDMYEDGMQFGNWEDVTIDRNTIGHINDPAEVIHNDAIQFTGNASNVVISDNTLYDVGHGQLLFIQPEFGPIDDVLVENNLIWDLGSSTAYAVQNQGATNVRFAYDTIWVPGWSGGLLLRHQPVEPYVAATDTQVIGNIVSSFSAIEGAAAAVYAHNLVGGDPLFVAPACGDFSLTDKSPARGAGDPDDYPSLDLSGRPRSSPPSAGALEWAPSAHKAGVRC